MIARRSDARPARRSKRRAGFALLAVIWGTGIISLLVVSFMTTGRLRLQTAHNIASATEAAFKADGVVSLVTMTLLAERDASAARPENAAVYDGAPRFCVFDGAAVAFGVEEEGGKVDLNAAPPELIQQMLVGLGADPRVAETVTKAIVAYRSPPAEMGQIAMAPVSDKPFQPKQAPFETVLELDQVSGVDPALFRALLPFVTVHSRSPTVDARSTPPGLFAALAQFPIEEVRALTAAPFPNRINRNDPRFPATLRQMGERGAFLIHVEALLATGQMASKDVIIDFQGAGDQPFKVKEIRRGQSRYVDDLRAMIASNGAGVADC